MRKEALSLRQAICFMILFIVGSSVVIGGASEAGQDSWVSFFIAAVMMIPVLLMYARIIHLFPETDLFDILVILFGKILGKVFIALFTWYAIHLGVLVVRNFSEFVEIVAMPETPQLPIMIGMILVTAYLARSGIETIGKWSVSVLPFILSVVTLTIALSLKDMDFSNILPIMEKSPITLLKSAYQTYTFPLAETVLFLCVASAFKKQDSPYKIYTYAILLGSLILLVVLLRNIEVLGAAMAGASYFASYTTARIIHIGDFLTRIEGSISVNFILSGITKITLCLLAAAKGTAKLFEIQDYKRILMPVSLLALALSTIIYDSTMEMFGFLKYYQYYAIPFQILLPVLIWVAAEIHAKKQSAAAKA